MAKKIFNEVRSLPEFDKDLEKLKKFKTLKDDEVVKSQKSEVFVIPAEAGIQCFQVVTCFLDSRFHGNDDFLRACQRRLRYIYRETTSAFS